MRFLWLAHAIPYPPKAGFLARSYNLLRELAREHTVDLIAFVQERWVTTLSPSLAEGLEESRCALGQFCDRVTFLPIDNVRRPWGRQLTALRSLVTGSSFTTSWLVSPRARSEIARQLSTCVYDLVHFDTIGLAPYQYSVGATPAVLTHQNIESHMMRRRGDNVSNVIARGYFHHEARLLEDFEKSTAADFAAHITCSDLDRARWLALVPNANTVTIPNGVDCEYFSSGSSEIRRCSLVFVGTMDWYPNLEAMSFFLREIWPAVKQRAPSATMDIAGTNPPKSLRHLARSLPGVTVHGYIPDVRPLIESAALYVCPIRDGGGTKLKILDAFAMKKCVVAHPIACEGINVTADVNVVLATSAVEFVDTIVTLLADHERCQTIGEAARGLVESQYSFSAIGAQFRGALCAAAEARQRRPSV